MSLLTGREADDLAPGVVGAVGVRGLIVLRVTVCWLRSSESSILIVLKLGGFSMFNVP